MFIKFCVKMSDDEFSSQGDDEIEDDLDEIDLGLGRDPEASESESENSDSNKSDSEESESELESESEPEPDEDEVVVKSRVRSNGINTIRYSLLSQDTIQGMGYRVGKDPKDPSGPYGINSPYLGPYNVDYSSDSICEMCGKKQLNCPGHYGHIKLHIPVAHPLTKQSLYYILCSVCHNCGKPAISPAKLLALNFSKIPAAKRLKLLMTEANKNRKTKKTREPCPHCKSPLYPVVFKKTESLFYEEADELHQIEMNRILELLKTVQKDKKTVDLLGFKGSIDGMLIKYLPVIPPVCRPPVYRNEEQTDSDLTIVYTQIVRINYNIHQMMKGNCKKSTDVFKEISSEYLKLVNSIETLINSGPMKGFVQRGGRIYKTLTALIKGKRGHMRGNVMGKRNNFTARTVVSAGADLEIDELGVPVYIARKITRKEIVCKINQKRLLDLVRDGKANYIIRDEQQIYIPPSKRNSFEIKIGDVVERQLQNGDFVILHRHPTLHGGSMQGVRVRIVEGLTFQVNLCITTPLNMDFDGDEGNMYPAGDDQGAAEIETLFHVNKRILSNQGSTTMIGMVQDALLGSYILTRENDVMSLPRFCDCLYRARRDHTLKSLRMRARRQDQRKYMYMEKFVELAKKYHKTTEDVVKAVMKECNECDWETPGDMQLYAIEQIYDQLCEQITPQLRKNLDVELEELNSEHGAELSGKFLFSSLFPETLQYVHGGIVIRDGILLLGHMTKATLGRSNNSLIRYLATEYGNQVCADFMSECQWLINLWMTERGFSVGFRDCLVEDDSIIESAMNTIETRVDAIRRRPGFVDPIKQARHLENSEVAELANATAIGNKLATQLLTKYHNRFTDMSRSGSKGSDVNLAQIASAVGQQMVNGRRPQPQLANGTRTLAYFPPNDTSPESRGFVRHCYLIGLTVSEFFMHTMGGREGLTDSALKTAETGYIQRKLVKTTEDLVTHEDGTIRTGADGKLAKIVCWSYGNDHSLPATNVPYNGKKFFCDVGNLVDSLNARFELETAQESKDWKKAKLPLFGAPYRDRIPVEVPVKKVVKKTRQIKK